MKQSLIHVVSAAGLLLSGLFSAAFAEPARESRYTNLKECRLVESQEDEGGYSLSSCAGHGGYKLDVVDADARENIFVITPKGQKQSLQLPSRMGGGFSSLGDTIEWRGRVEGGTLHPTAMIARYRVEDPSGPGRPTSYLLVISLPGKPCLAAEIAPGPNQNERARAAADGKLYCLPED
ncbi:hypothetical protein ACFOEZ_12380 [Tianweitania populi]|uniref:Uncharacterized protein n=1 Tax=Tianweitania populi TaxID=1607949 RepID=A0A8J3DYQ6_9HYPH|nr:hypothetical protein [Tianweitania populi]GHD20028.1 hypothetical protein GCM10016234_32430 [Tianweitania populi]